MVERIYYLEFNKSHIDLDKIVEIKDADLAGHFDTPTARFYIHYTGEENSIYYTREFNEDEMEYKTNIVGSNLIMVDGSKEEYNSWSDQRMMG